MIMLEENLIAIVGIKLLNGVQKKSRVSLNASLKFKNIRKPQMETGLAQALHDNNGKLQSILFPWVEASIQDRMVNVLPLE